MAINTSISSGSSAFNFDGVASGLNTTSIIASMMKLQQGPLNGLKAQQTKVQARDSAYQSVEAQVSSFQLALNTLLIPSNVNAKMVTSTPATGTTATVATATASGAATPAAYALNVDHLATASTATSSVFNAGQSKWLTAPIGAGVKDGTEGGTPTPLASAGFAITPTAGTFTINGTPVTIADPTTQSLNAIVDAINSSVAGVTASITTDTNGNKNFISLHALNGQAIQLGSGGDTSNFLSAAHLVSTGAVGDVASSVPIGTPNTGGLLSTVHLGTALTATTGSFQVNGKTINWDSTTDSLNAVMGKINSAGAGVTATYDATQDSVSITNMATGSASVALTGDTGGMLAALHLGAGAAQESIGKTAQFQINGGAWQYSNSNTVSDRLPGVSIALLAPGATMLSVGQDTATSVTNVNSFIKAFNTLVDSIDKLTTYDATNKVGGALTGDSGMTSFADQVRGMLTSAVSGLSGQFNSLASIGISTGSFGAAVGTTGHLVLDQTKLTAALQADPNSVVNVMGGTAAPVLNPDSQGAPGAGTWVSHLAGAPANVQHGRYSVSVDASGNVTTVFTPAGSTPQAAVGGSITANGSNSSLIPGLTISVGALPTSGTRTDSITFGSKGVLGRLSDYLSAQMGTGGLFDAEHSGATTGLASLANQITSANDLLTQRQQTLQTQFTAMETALAQLNSQGGSLLSSLGITPTTQAAPSGSA